MKIILTTFFLSAFCLAVFGYPTPLFRTNDNAIILPANPIFPNATYFTNLVIPSGGSLTIGGQIYTALTNSAGGGGSATNVNFTPGNFITPAVVNGSNQFNLTASVITNNTSGWSAKPSYNLHEIGNFSIASGDLTQLAVSNYFLLADTSVSNIVVTVTNPPAAGNVGFWIVNYGNNGDTITLQATTPLFITNFTFTALYSTTYSVAPYYGDAAWVQSMNGTNWYVVPYIGWLHQAANITAAQAADFASATNVLAPKTNASLYGTTLFTNGSGLFLDSTGLKHNNQVTTTFIWDVDSYTIGNVFEFGYDPGNSAFELALPVEGNLQLFNGDYFQGWGKNITNMPLSGLQFMPLTNNETAATIFGGNLTVQGTAIFSANGADYNGPLIDKNSSSGNTYQMLGSIGGGNGVQWQNDGGGLTNIGNVFGNTNLFAPAALNLITNAAIGAINSAGLPTYNSTLYNLNMAGNSISFPTNVGVRLQGSSLASVNVYYLTNTTLGGYTNSVTGAAILYSTDTGFSTITTNGVLTGFQIQGQNYGNAVNYVQWTDNTNLTMLVPPVSQWFAAIDGTGVQINNSSFSGNGSGLTNVNASTLGSVSANAIALSATNMFYVDPVNGNDAAPINGKRYKTLGALNNANLTVGYSAILFPGLIYNTNGTAMQLPDNTRLYGYVGSTLMGGPNLKMGHNCVLYGITFSNMVVNDNGNYVGGTTNPIIVYCTWLNFNSQDCILPTVNFIGGIFKNCTIQSGYDAILSWDLGIIEDSDVTVNYLGSNTRSAFGRPITCDGTIVKNCHLVTTNNPIASCAIQCDTDYNNQLEVDNCTLQVQTTNGAATAFQAFTTVTGSGYAFNGTNGWPPSLVSYANGTGFTNMQGTAGATNAQVFGATTSTNIFSYSVPAGVTNGYNVSAFLNVTALSLDVLQPKVVYTDERGNVQTVSLGAALSGTGNDAIQGVSIWAKGGTSVFVTNALTTATGSITYDAKAKIDVWQ